MHSQTTITKTNNFPKSIYLAHDNEPEPKKEKLGAGPRATWKPGGYTPTRASWNSVRGRIQRFFA